MHIAKHYGITNKIVDLLKNWYPGISSSVRLDGEEGDWFPITKGLRQSCVMSPSLFNINRDAMRKVTEEATGGVMVVSERVMYLDLADYVALLADS